MNTLKPLLICAVLAGIGYGVYVRINSGGDAPPPGVSDGWNSVPEIQLPDPTSPGVLPSGMSSTAPSSPGIGGGFGGSAPPFGAGQSAPPTGAQHDAPAFQQPAVASSPSSASSAPPFGDAASNPPAGGDQMPSDAAQFNPNSPNSTPGSPDQFAQPQQPDAALGPATSPDGVAPDGYSASTASVPDRYRAAELDNAPPAQQPPGQQMPQQPGQPATPGQQPPADGSFADALDSVRHELEAGQMTRALEQLSSWYDDPRLAPAERQQLNQLLDQVAGTVVYSTQHMLEPPYEVQPGERLEDIGQRYNVPWKLLAKINGIEDPNTLRPGERLKVIRGPFSATISLEKRELTLLLANGSYAGRFPIGIGVEQPPREGTFAVSDKVVNPVYHGREKAVGAGDEGNPYGQRWIGLGSDMGIHGTNRAENIGRTDLPGSISLSPHDVEDVFDILATGSKVTIRR